MSALLKVLFIGDVVGKGGRNAVRELVPVLKQEYRCSFVIVNAENCANGSGLTAACLREMGDQVDVFTSGDHTWDQKQLETEIQHIPNLIRPANFSEKQPGVGWKVFRNPAGGEIAVVALMGKVFMRDSAYCPYEVMEKILTKLPATCKTVIVDMHAEATSEKAAMAWMYDGKITAVIGTHTHVQTNDARVLPNGTAMLTDVGMVGAKDSILGREVPDVVKKFRTGMPVRLNVREKEIRLDAAVITYELATGKAVAIEPIQRMYKEEQ